MYGKRIYSRRRSSYRKRSSASYRRRKGLRTSMYRRSKALSLYRPLGRSWTNPLPNQRLFKFVYNDDGFTIDTGVGKINNYIMSANSPYDPDYAGASIQPYGWDQMMGANGPFDQYMVLGSKATVYVHSCSSENKAPVKVTLVPWLTNSFPSAIETSDLMRHYRAKSNLIDLVKDDTRNCKITNYVSTKSMAYHGLLDDGYGAGYNANPLVRTFWYILFDTLTAGLQCTFKFDLKITYYTKCFQSHADLNES